MKTIKFITLLIFTSFALLAFSNSVQAGALLNYTILDDATGGDCEGTSGNGPIGVWDATTKNVYLLEM